MREHKFRGKRVDNSEWVYGCYGFNPFFKRADIFAFDDVRSYVYEVVPESVGEFTGLRDTKRTAEYPEGQEIYEGDILDCSYINPMSGQKIIKHYRVVFDSGVFKVELIGKTPYGDTLLYFQNGKGEVIGNIFENSDLLK